ncbi:MAG: hypothetical protein LBP89_09635 [Helicobacteraceae bacterium]|jgi:hypothetical protein|nr:hypothetical protein [Helicobacteraceae bacterium]
MKRKVFLVALSVIALGFSGCATLVGGGGVQSVSLQTSDSKQAEATVMSTSGTQIVTLPTTLMLQRGNIPLTVNIKETTTTDASSYSRKPKINPWFFGNIITGGLVGSTTDAVTGSMWAYDQNMIVPVTRK